MCFAFNFLIEIIGKYQDILMQKKACVARMFFLLHVGYDLFVVLYLYLFMVKIVNNNNILRV